jgi:Dolichyl-phosphate-mannose-protein mannosyltransferase
MTYLAQTRPARPRCDIARERSVEDTSGARYGVLVLIAATLVVRLLFGFCLGLGIDESYTVATGRHPQLSTFDHPPAAWWLAWGAGRLFATESALVLRLPFILLFAVTTWLTYRLTAYLFDERAGFWAAATLNLAPVIAWTSGTWILPDGPLNAALMVGAYATAKAVLGSRRTAPLLWLAAGGCGGLSLLSKFHGVFLFAGVALFLLTCHAHRRWLLTPWPYAAAVVAAFVFLPVVVWNEQHAWVSFAFQGGRARLHGINLLGPLAALGGQALYLLPWLWLPLVACFAKAIAAGPADHRRWLLACLAIGPILCFTAVALMGGRVLPHWAAPGYLMLFPLLGAELARRLESRDRVAQGWLIVTAGSLASLLALVILMSQIPWPTIVGPGGKVVPNPFLEVVDWKDLKAEIETRGLANKPNLIVVATRWHEAGKIDYALGGRLPVLCLCRDPRGYGVLTRPRAHLGKTALIIGRDLPQERVATTYGAYFENIEQMRPIAIAHAGEQAFELSVYLGHGIRAPNETPNLLDRSQSASASAQ